MKPKKEKDRTGSRAAAPDITAWEPTCRCICRWQYGLACVGRARQRVEHSGWGDRVDASSLGSGVCARSAGAP